jgi:hypothetical protein
MAERLINVQQQAQLAQQQEQAVSQTTPQPLQQPLATIKSGSSIASAVSGKTPPHESNVESISKKIIGGIKLPFMNFTSAPQNAEKASTSTNSDTKDFVVPQRLDLASSSKSKRPISTQLFDNAAGAPATANHHLTQPSSNIQLNISDSMLSNGKDSLSSSSSPAKKANLSSTNVNAATDEKMNLSLSNENIVEPMTDEENDEENNHASSSKLAKTRSKSSSSRGGDAKLDDNENKHDDSATAKTTTNSAVTTVSSRTAVTGPNMPVPAPRKTKSSVKSFLGGLMGSSSPAAAAVTSINSASTSSSSSSASSLTSSSFSSLTNSPPKHVRKIANTISEETNGVSGELELLKTAVISNGGSAVETSATTNGEVKQLEHLNKTRPKRPNVKRPTVKNPQSQIEIEITPDNEDSSHTLSVVHEHDVSSIAASAIAPLVESSSSRPGGEVTVASEIRLEAAAPVIGLNRVESFDELLSVQLNGGQDQLQVSGAGQPKPISPVLKNTVEQPKVR